MLIYFLPLVSFLSAQFFAVKGRRCYPCKRKESDTISEKCWRFKPWCDKGISTRILMLLISGTFLLFCLALLRCKSCQFVIACAKHYSSLNNIGANVAITSFLSRGLSLFLPWLIWSWYCFIWTDDFPKYDNHNFSFSDITRHFIIFTYLLYFFAIFLTIWLVCVSPIQQVLKSQRSIWSWEVAH